MQKKNLRSFLGAPAQSQDTHHEALRMIEDDCLTDAAMARNLPRSEQKIRHADVISQEDLLELYRVHQ
jgi:hypothetical protein